MKPHVLAILALAATSEACVSSAPSKDAAVAAARAVLDDSSLLAPCVSQVGGGTLVSFQQQPDTAIVRFDVSPFPMVYVNSSGEPVVLSWRHEESPDSATLQKRHVSQSVEVPSRRAPREEHVHCARESSIGTRIEIIVDSPAAPLGFEVDAIVVRARTPSIVFRERYP